MFLQMSNLRQVVAHLKYSRFINILLRSGHVVITVIMRRQPVTFYSELFTWTWNCVDLDSDYKFYKDVNM